MNSFLDAIKRVQESQGGQVFEALLGLFTVVTSLNENQVVATFQAYQTYRYHILSEAERKANEGLLDKIFEALADRMLTICEQEDSPMKRLATARIFRQVTGLDARFKRFIPFE